MKDFKKRSLSLLSLVVILFYTAVFFLLPISHPINNVYAATTFSQAKVVLSNSRFSYKAVLSGTHTAPLTTATIATSGQADNDTGNIFPKDNICFNTVLSVIGCSENKTFAVNNIFAVSGSNQFSFTPATATNLAASDYVVSTQSATMTVTFTPTSAVASGGYLRVTIPSLTSNYTDGIPDGGGFDANKLTNSNINANITPTGFTKSATALSYSAGTHVILMTLSAALAAGTEYSFVIGSTSDSTLRFINPAPTGTAHVRGVADTYSFTFNSEDSSNVIIDKNILKLVPIDGVLVSATVEMTISYTIGAIAATQSVCGLTTSVASTATTVPFGSLASSNTFYNLAQSHTVTTNATRGYSLTVQYNGALSKDGAGVTTIADTTCDSASCNTTTPGPWLTATNNGFGYTMAGDDGVWVTPTLYFRPFPTSPIQIMTNSAPAASKVLNTCYRLSVSGTQQTGYYFNKLTYTITPMF